MSVAAQQPLLFEQHWSVGFTQQLCLQHGSPQH
jgi:hypothetical protein